MSWPLIQERYKSGIYQQHSRKPFLSSSSLTVILEWSPTDSLHFDILWYITNISLLTLLSLDIPSFLGIHDIPFFWNFHSFLSPLYLLCRCLFCLFLNKRALQVYSSRSFHSVCVCVCARAHACTAQSHFSCALLFATIWTIACQAPLTMGFSM